MNNFLAPELINFQFFIRKMLFFSLLQKLNFWVGQPNAQINNLRQFKAAKMSAFWLFLLNPAGYTVLAVYLMN